MATIPLPPDRDQAGPALSRALGFADSLFKSLDRLDEAGGSRRAMAGWSVAAIDRALGSLLAAREGLDGEITRIEERRKHYPRRRRLG